MIYGNGIDIAKVARFEKWIKDKKMISRFFNPEECIVSEGKNINRVCEHYAARFAAKEAFVKALGTGFTGVELKRFWVSKDENGKPYMKLDDKMSDFVKKRVGNNFNIHLSLSHEAEYAVASVIIESL